MSDDNKNFEAALDLFLRTAQALVNERYEGAGGSDNAPSIMADQPGAKFLRIIETRGGIDRSVYCFVEIATGNVLKAESWKKPAPGPRGSIYAKDVAGYGINGYGANYKR